MATQRISNKPADSLPPIGKFIVLVGLMGAGKSNVGKWLSSALSMPFVDTDHEIEAAANSTIEEIFDEFGEQFFRDGERRVLRRLLGGDPAVLATGGGAFVDAQTRILVKKKGISIWLRADLDLLVKRTSRRTNRPLLKNGEPRTILRKLMSDRNPIYAESDIVVDVGEESAATTSRRVLATLIDYVERQGQVRVNE